MLTKKTEQKTGIKEPIIEKNELKSLCNDILETSLYWTGEDEEINPGLKRIRTLAGLYFHRLV